MSCRVSLITTLELKTSRRDILHQHALIHIKPTAIMVGNRRAPVHEKYDADALAVRTELRRNSDAVGCKLAPCEETESWRR